MSRLIAGQAVVRGAENGVVGPVGEILKQGNFGFAFAGPERGEIRPDVAQGKAGFAKGLAKRGTGPIHIQPQSGLCARSKFAQGADQGGSGRGRAGASLPAQDPGQGATGKAGGPGSGREDAVLRRSEDGAGQGRPGLSKGQVYPGDIAQIVRANENPCRKAGAFQPGVELMEKRAVHEAFPWLGVMEANSVLTDIRAVHGLQPIDPLRGCGGNHSPHAGPGRQALILKSGSP